jgi:hypothetical protein
MRGGASHPCSERLARRAPPPPCARGARRARAEVAYSTLYDSTILHCVRMAMHRSSAYCICTQAVLCRCRPCKVRCTLLLLAACTVPPVRDRSTGWLAGRVGVVLRCCMCALRRLTRDSIDLIRARMFWLE